MSSRSPTSANNSTTFSFDALNRETGSTDALNDITTYVYDADGDLTSDEEPTPAGQTARTTNYTYNSMNELTVSTDPLGLATSYGYDAAGNQVWVKDPMGRITTTIFDALNRPDRRDRPDGEQHDDDATTRTTKSCRPSIPWAGSRPRPISVSGWVPTVTDPLDLTQTYTYNSTGQTISTTQKGASGGGPEYTSYNYNADDELTSVEDALGNLTSYSYDGVGNLISTHRSQ